MKEIDTSWHKTKGHLKLSSDEILQSLYRVATHFFGSNRLTELANEDTGAHFDQLRERFEEAEIQRLLLTVAVRIRILDDDLQELHTEDTSKWFVGVGKLFLDSNQGHFIDLTLREACNKIIHARLFNFIREEEAPEGECLFPLLPKIAIYGTRQRSAVFWKANLDIEGFVNAAISITEESDLTRS